MAYSFLRVSRMLLVMLLLATIGLRSGQVGGIPIFDDGDSKKKAAEFALTDVRALFPSASTYKRTDTDVIKVFNGQIQLGTIISSSPLADSIAGYASSVPVLIGVNMSNKIVGVRLLKNYESADFVAKIYRSGFLESWTGKSVHDGAALKTDGVSGATVTSQALISTIRFSLSRQSSKELDAEQGLTLAQLLRLAAAFTLLAASIAQLIYPAKLKRFRIPLQIATIAVVGFWIGDSLSMQLLYSWLIYGVTLSQKLFLVAAVLAAIAIPLLTNKAFYCTYLCPYGAAQELAGKLSKRKIRITPRVMQYLMHLREWLFGVLLFLLLLGVSLDITYVEPFSAFAYKSAGWPILTLAILFVVLSIFIPRAWCRFFCPTGQLLEFIRRLLIVKPSSSK